MIDFENAPTAAELAREEHEMRASVSEDGRTCLDCANDLADCECADEDY